MAKQTDNIKGEQVVWHVRPAVVVVLILSAVLIYLVVNHMGDSVEYGEVEGNIEHIEYLYLKDRASSLGYQGTLLLTVEGKQYYLHAPMAHHHLAVGDRVRLEYSGVTSKREDYEPIPSLVKALSIVGDEGVDG